MSTSPSQFPPLGLPKTPDNSQNDSETYVSQKNPPPAPKVPSRFYRPGGSSPQDVDFSRVARKINFADALHFQASNGDVSQTGHWFPSRPFTLGLADQTQFATAKRKQAGSPVRQVAPASVNPSLSKHPLENHHDSRHQAYMASPSELKSGMERLLRGDTLSDLDNSQGGHSFRGTSQSYHASPKPESKRRRRKRSMIPLPQIMERRLSQRRRQAPGMQKSHSFLAQSTNPIISSPLTRYDYIGKQDQPSNLSPFDSATLPDWSMKRSISESSYLNRANLLPESAMLSPRKQKSLQHAQRRRVNLTREVISDYGDYFGDCRTRGDFRVISVAEAF